jgi:hypothetical protein
MTVKITHIDRTSLNSEAFYKTANKYIKLLNLYYNVIIIFDNRLSQIAGDHDFDIKNKRHVIKISPRPNEYPNQSALKYSFLSTMLHELRHARQYERDRKCYDRNPYLLPELLLDKELAELYSQCETEARAFENKHLHSAIKYYNDMCLY